MSIINLLVVTSFIYALIYAIRRYRLRHPNSPLPPGPKPWPVIGNLFDMPSRNAWETYARWSKEFDSDVIHVNMAGTPVVILNTYEAAVDLFEKRSSLYSTRIRMPMLNELMGWDWNFGPMPYGEKWRHYRRLFHQAYDTNSAKHFQPQETEAARQLLLRFIDRPGDLMQQLRHLAGVVIMKTTYGIEILPENDPYITLAERAMQNFRKALIPGNFWVDFLPWLKYVPSWLPGAKFKRDAKEWAALTREMVDTPFEFAKQQTNEGKFNSSFVSNSLQRMATDPSVYRDESSIRDVAASAYAAGADTIVSALGTFVLAMLRHPEVQKKAQAELDQVLNGRLPTFDDQDSFPYLTAVIRETFRWKAVTTFVPHSVSSDDIYKGYRIPAGSLVIGNIWAMLQDEEMYPDPTIFNPERFLKDGKINPDIRDPSPLVFGFGRRACPGRHMAYSLMWINVASILATMDISKALDQNGEPIEPSSRAIFVFDSASKQFPCSIKPRSPHAEALVRASAVSED